MYPDLKGKVVVITGGSSGIGKAAAKAFAQEGCNVAICGRNEDKLSKVIEEFKELGFEVIGEKVDASNLNDMTTFAKSIIDTFGKIDIWINNAGIYPQKFIVDMSESEWDQVVNINLKSVFLGSKIASLWMKGRGGVIINATSFAAIIPSAGSGAYAATKAAIMSLTRTLAAELAPFNIRVNGYIPGVIKTDMTEQVIKENEKALLDQIALKRLGTPEDVAEPLLFLASDASRYMTGTFVEVSGGKLCVQNPSFAWKNISDKF